MERNSIILLVKELVSTTEYMYDNSMEREYATHIQRKKLVNESCDGLWIGRIELLTKIIGYIKTKPYYLQRVFSVKELYYNIWGIINDMIKDGKLESPKKAKERREAQEKINKLFNSQTTVEGYIASVKGE